MSEPAPDTAPSEPPAEPMPAPQTEPAPVMPAAQTEVAPVMSAAQTEVAPVMPAAQTEVAPMPLPGADAQPARDPGSHATRAIALGWLALSALLVWFFAGQAFASDLGTENARLRLVIRAAAVLIPAYPGLLALAALLSGHRPSVRWNVLSLPFEAWWYATLGTMTWREVKGFFGRPVAYIVIFFWLLLNGYFFLALLDHYGGAEAWGKDFQEPPSQYVTGNFLMLFSLALMCPALTMRLLAEESSNGSMEMLLTAPVTHTQVMLSKYLSAIAFYVCLLLATGIYMAILSAYATEWDWGPVLGGYLGLFLMGALFLSVGLFTSSVADNQIVAFILAVLPNMLLIFIFLVQNIVPFDWAKEVVKHINIWELHQEFLKGIVHWRSLAFYVSSTVFFLFLAVRGVESHTWR